jgi:hypothetical protein
MNVIHITAHSVCHELLMTNCIDAEELSLLGCYALFLVPSSPIFITLMMEALSSSESLVLTRATRLNIREDAILHTHRRENLKSYVLTQSLERLVTDRMIECKNSNPGKIRNFHFLILGRLALWPTQPSCPNGAGGYFVQDKPAVTRNWQLNSKQYRNEVVGLRYVRFQLSWLWLWRMSPSGI